MLKIFLLLSSIIFLTGCSVTNRTEYLFGQVTYEEKQPKWSISIESDNESKSKHEKSIIVLIDTNRVADYSTKFSYKKYKGEKYRYIVNKSDTSRSIGMGTSYVYSDFRISKTYIPPKHKYPTPYNSHKGIQFKEDGSCIETNVTNCSDSPCSTKRQKLGEYRVIKDTVYIAFYMGRSWSSSFNRLKESRLKSIEDVPWDVTTPTELTYTLSSQQDTLSIIQGSKYSGWNAYFIDLDSI